jgi:hypothetical protein
MTIRSTNTNGPEPGDVVIGIQVLCGTENPGLDGKYDRVIRISYRPPGLPPIDGPIKPPEPPTGAFPFPQNGRTGGAIKDATGTVWIDTLVFGQPPSNLSGDDKPDNNLGDDSEDIASRIEQSVEGGRLNGVINKGDIIVEHNQQSDTSPKDSAGRDQECREGKPQHKDRGRIRIRLRNPSHYDVATHDQKIEVTVIEFPEDGPGGGTPDSGGAIEIDPSIPDRIPDERDKEPDTSFPVRGPATGVRRRSPAKRTRNGQAGEEWADDVKPYLRDDMPWRTPRWRNRRWRHSGTWAPPAGDSSPINVDRILEVGRILSPEIVEIVEVQVVECRHHQIQLLSAALRLLGFCTRIRHGKLFYSCWTSPMPHVSGSSALLFRMRGVPWHISVTKLAIRDNSALSLDGSHRPTGTGFRPEQLGDLIQPMAMPRTRGHNMS